jgi:hypothetical protein
MNSFKFYADAGLTTVVSARTIAHFVTGANDPQDFVFYYGSTEASSKVGAESNPGVDQITVNITNATPVWSASAAKVVNDRVRTTAKNGYRYKVQSITGGGLTGASQPTWPTPIGATVVDNQVTWINEGKVHESTEIKLALSNAGLATAIAGASLALGTVINSGSANAIAVHMRIDDATAVVGSASELSINTVSTHEIPVGESW